MSAVINANIVVLSVKSNNSRVTSRNKSLYLVDIHQILFATNLKIELLLRRSSAMNAAKDTIPADTVVSIYAMNARTNSSRAMSSQK